MRILTASAALLFATACAGAQEAAVELRGVVDIAVVKESRKDLDVESDRENGFEVVSRVQPAAGWTLAAVAAVRTTTRFDSAGTGRRVTDADGILTATGPAGQLRLGRAYTAAQDALFNFEPFEFRTVGTLLAITGNYVSAPEYGGAAGFQFVRAMHYRSPSIEGWRAAFSAANPTASSTAGRRPWSAALTFDAARWRAMAGWERATNEDRFDNVSMAFELGSVLWMATWGVFRPVAGMGAQRSVAVGGVASWSDTVKLRFGYGRVDHQGGIPERQSAVGVWWQLSQSVGVYTDLSAVPNRRSIDLGLRYEFKSASQSR